MTWAPSMFLSFSQANSEASGSRSILVIES